MSCWRVALFASNPAAKLLFLAKARSCVGDEVVIVKSPHLSLSCRPRERTPQRSASKPPPLPLVGLCRTPCSSLTRRALLALIESQINKARHEGRKVPNFPTLFNH